MVAAKQKQWSDRASLEDALGHGLTQKEFNGITEVLQRPVSVLELGICAALYSEHCSYKSTKVHLKNLPCDGPRVVQGPGENAGVVDIGDNETVVFKVESHNHPSFIEPFQGAATGVGGILRDVFTMGARPVALMNALRFGARDNQRTPYLLSRAVAGIGGYGNCVGVPTVGGELYFHESYNGNCLVNAFALGIADKDKIFLGKASGVGNPVIYFGSKTGRDGIKGAIMASESFEDDSEEKRPTVQVGDPFQEKLLIEACLAVMQSGAVVGIQDMGAAGMTCACFEMADRAGTGVRIDLDRVPQRETAMTPYEIMLSESQERMVAVVQRGREEEVLKILRHWELDAVQIGEVIEGTDVELFWHGERVSSMPVALVTASVPQYRWPEERPSDFETRNSFDLQDLPEPQDLSSVWMQLLGSVNLCSRRPVFNQYDSTVRTNTVVHPGGDAAVIRVKSKHRMREKGIAMTLDCNSLYCSIDPRQGVALSVAEACRNIAAVGALPIGLSDCLNFGSPERPESMWQIAESIRGLAEACRAFEVPIVSGNVSLYNETRGKSVLPTPLLAVVGLLEDVSKAVGAHFKKPNDTILLLGTTNATELGGSEYLSAIARVERGALPRLDYDLEIKHANFVRCLIDRGLLRSAHDLSSGGLAIALAEGCLNPYDAFGARITVLEHTGRADGLLFAETGARYLVSCDPKHEEEIRNLAYSAGVPISAYGQVGGETITIEGYASVSLPDAYERWQNGLSALFEG
ncbi:MAG: phosphoribosylformylglycinamidine synthase subunit PurL [Proteobacteria bacterium]|nr:phosphoribosylformylglycinamidine synthase subunit PurL [Pseudomonadota bacterium]